MACEAGLARRTRQRRHVPCRRSFGGAGGASGSHSRHSQHRPAANEEPCQIGVSQLLQRGPEGKGG